MKILLTRESVAMGDDIEAPHNAEFTVPDNTSVATIIETVFHSNYLASIAGGKATWSVISAIPLAIVAQQWVLPKLLLPIPPFSSLNFSDNTLALHFNYHAQHDPDLVYNQLYEAHKRREH